MTAGKRMVQIVLMCCSNYDPSDASEKRSRTGGFWMLESDPQRRGRLCLVHWEKGREWPSGCCHVLLKTTANNSCMVLECRGCDCWECGCFKDNCQWREDALSDVYR